MKRKTIYIAVGIIIFIFFTLLIYFNTRVAKTATLHQQLLARYSQNAFDYIKQNRKVDHNYQITLARNYLSHYFSPWNGKKNPFFSLQTIRKTEFEHAKTPKSIDSYGINFQKHSLKWYQKIIVNMDLKKFPNLNMRGIVVHDTYLRELPTIDPAFEDPNEAGQGYPFDQLQIATLLKGEPIYVYHISKNGKWCLVGTDFNFGWIKTADMAFVTNVFIESWMQHEFVVPLKDDISVYDANQNYRFTTYIGSLYPLQSVTSDYYQVLTIAANPKTRYADMIVTNLPKKFAAVFPLPLTTKNIAFIINRLQDHPYGWGGLDAYRDCSLTTRNLFATFGIWLPRTAEQQVKSAQVITLDKLSNHAKTKLIINRGIPFMTLIHKPGHILLYIGHKGNQIFVFHNMWGLETRNFFFKKGRAIAGMPVITTLNFGSHYHNVPSTYLDDADKIFNLIPR